MSEIEDRLKERARIDALHAATDALITPQVRTDFKALAVASYAAFRAAFSAQAAEKTYLDGLVAQGAYLSYTDNYMRPTRLTIAGMDVRAIDLRAMWQTLSECGHLAGTQYEVWSLPT